LVSEADVCGVWLAGDTEYALSRAMGLDTLVGGRHECIVGPKLEVGGQDVNRYVPEEPGAGIGNDVIVEDLVDHFAYALLLHLANRGFFADTALNVEMLWEPRR
jgi:hypothetical protein